MTVAQAIVCLSFTLFGFGLGVIFCCVMWPAPMHGGFSRAWGEAWRDGPSDIQGPISGYG